MSQPFQLTYSEEFLKYSLGPTHPMNPRRIAASISLMDYLLKDKDDFSIVAPNPIDPAVLELSHSLEYIRTMKKLSDPGFNPSFEEQFQSMSKFGIGTGDCPVFDYMAEISELIVGSTVTAAERMLEGKLSKAFVMLAGLHHASREKASGFCYYNDINVAIHRLKSLQDDIKILYLDTDLHAGDGVNYEFYNDPNILTISFHESGEYLFPGTCFSHEIGVNEGQGYAVNFPAFPYTYDNLYQKAIRNYLPALFESFNPDMVIFQAGVDGHADDPLGHLQLTTSTYSTVGNLVSRLSETMDSPRILALGGGGYNPISVAKSWLAEVSSLAGIKPIETAPKSWITHCKEDLQVDMPETLIDDPLNLAKNQKELVTQQFQNTIDDFEKHLSPFWSL